MDRRKDSLEVGRTEAVAASLGLRPLYRQVRDVILQRIADGVWRPGQSLPSEGEIAADLGVSQGTARKALDSLAAENFVVRRQGRGTFVTKHDDARILFQFFKLVPDSGKRHFPDSDILDVGTGPATEEARRALALKPGARVAFLERVRSLGGVICIFERIVLPKDLFPGIEKQDLPNNLYELYRAQFGITIARASERLKAVAAKRREAKCLGVDVGAPLLLVDRIAFDIGGRPVEWRASYCRTDQVHYLSDLR